jgi:hypothetical protein
MNMNTIKYSRDILAHLISLRSGLLARPARPLVLLRDCKFVSQNWRRDHGLP